MQVNKTTCTAKCSPTIISHGILQISVDSVAGHNFSQLGSKGVRVFQLITRKY